MDHSQPPPTSPIRSRISLGSLTTPASGPPSAPQSQFPLSSAHHQSNFQNSRSPIQQHSTTLPGISSIQHNYSPPPQPPQRQSPVEYNRRPSGSPLPGESYPQHHSPTQRHFPDFGPSLSRIQQQTHHHQRQHSVGGGPLLSPIQMTQSYPQQQQQQQQQQPGGQTQMQYQYHQPPPQPSQYALPSPTQQSHGYPAHSPTQVNYHPVQQPLHHPQQPQQTPAQHLSRQPQLPKAIPPRPPIGQLQQRQGPPVPGVPKQPSPTPALASLIPPGGAPARKYLNEKVTPALLEGMKMLAREQPKDPLLVLAKFLEERHKEIVQKANVKMEDVNGDAA